MHIMRLRKSSERQKFADPFVGKPSAEISKLHPMLDGRRFSKLWLRGNKNEEKEGEEKFHACRNEAGRDSRKVPRKAAAGSEEQDEEERHGF